MRESGPRNRDEDGDDDGDVDEDVTAAMVPPMALRRHREREGGGSPLCASSSMASP